MFIQNDQKVREFRIRCLKSSKVIMKFIGIQVLISLCLGSDAITKGNGSEEQLQELKIAMPKVQTNRIDSYMCLATSVKDIDAEIVGYKFGATYGVAHHVSFAVCEDVASDKTIWECRDNQGSLCTGRAINVGKWNHLADKMETMFSNGNEDMHKSLDEYEFWSDLSTECSVSCQLASKIDATDVGIHLGAAEKFNQLLLQVHFKNKQPSPELQRTNAANLTLYLSNSRRQFTTQMVVFASTGFVPGNSQNFSSEMAFVWRGIPVTAVKYFLHTHAHGMLVEGYVIQDGKATLLGRALPLKDHKDKKDLLSGPITIRPGDILAARCLFNNSNDTPIPFGMTGKDEMCNFYFDFKYDANKANVYQKALLAQSNAQDHVWCTDKIPGTKILCDR